MLCLSAFEQHSRWVPLTSKALKSRHCFFSSENGFLFYQGDMILEVNPNPNPNPNPKALKSRHCFFFPQKMASYFIKET